jgi:hypothetical protein
LTERSSRLVVRKLALPLEIQMGDDTVVSDGFFSLTSRESSKLHVKSIDSDGYVTCEITPPSKLRVQTITEFVDREAELIGTELSKSRGSGEELGHYKYYKRPDGFYYAIVESKNRERKIHLGKLANRKSSISIFARTVTRLLNGKEFTKKDIANHIKDGMPKRLTHGQILKSMLFILTREGYLQKREAHEHKRPREYYKTTAKMLNLMEIASLEQA